MDIDIKINSVGSILLDELTDPIYLFELYSFILWYCSGYYYYSTLVLFITLISIIMSVYETYQNLKKLQQISKYSCKVKIFRK